MTRSILITILCICSLLSDAQTNPVITSWLQNTTGITGRHYVSGNSTPITDATLANVQTVKYSANWVYITTQGIPSYITGPYLDGNPSVATGQNAIYKFPLNPVKNTGTLTNTTGGNIGVFINGVSFFDYRDGVSWKSSTNSLAGGPLGGVGDGVWNRDAVVAERMGFDCAKGHPAMGNYHHHQNPSAFNLDINVISTVCNLYLADGLYVINGTTHSPLIGFAYDGFPVYGAYGYLNVDGTGGIVRMKSSYSLRNITTRTTYYTGTSVTAGPPVSTTYPLGYFREDYQYNATSAATPDYLDSHNGRFCVTPEYPNGTYCYFATVNANWNSTYPYLVGPTFYGVVTAAKVGSITETVTTYLQPSVSISASATTICSGTNVSFTATPTNGGTTPTYQWKKNGSNVGTNSSSYSNNTLSNSDVISCVLTTSTLAVATSNNITMTVNASVTPSVSISASATTICSGTNVSFTATPVNGGTTPTYQWKKNGSNVGTNSTSYAANTFSNIDVITCVMTSNASCASTTTATSNSITMTVNALPATPAGSVTQQTSCVFTKGIITLTAPLGASYTYSTDGINYQSGYVFNNVNPGTYSITSKNNGCVSANSLSLTVNTQPVCNSVTVDLKLYLQGYYESSGLMKPVLINQGVAAQANETDSIVIELHSITTPYTLVNSKQAVLLTGGTVSATFVQAPGSYYIAVKHRNSIQTWTASPVSCSATTPLYDFTTAASKAFGNNQAEVETGKWAFYKGDLNHDDYIDGNDFPIYDADSFNGISFEYRSTDLNGDGFVDGNDFPLFDTNSSIGILAIYPQ